MASISEIHFGTDGWRAVIGENFTFENVRNAPAGDPGTNLYTVRFFVFLIYYNFYF